MADSTIMFRLLFLIFLIIPIIEIYLLIQVGSAIGAIPTILAVIGTAVLGAALLRQQGISTLNRVQNTLGRGEIPALEMLEGLILLVSGALLLTPGFFTDAIGFICLVPPFRRAIVVWLLRHVNIIRPTGTPPGGPGERRGPDVIEGEYRRDD